MITANTKNGEKFQRIVRNLSTVVETLSSERRKPDKIFVSLNFKQLINLKEGYWLQSSLDKVKIFVKYFLRWEFAKLCCYTWLHLAVDPLRLELMRKSKSGIADDVH